MAPTSEEWAADAVADLERHEPSYTGQDVLDFMGTLDAGEDRDFYYLAWRSPPPRRSDFFRDYPAFRDWLHVRAAARMPAIGILHARVFDTRWGQGLVYIDITEPDDDTEGLRLQLWAPLCEDGGYAKASMFCPLKPGVPSERNREILAAMTAGQFEQTWAAYGMRDMLDRAFGIGGDGVG